jgi:hypothetical protein
MDDRRYISTPTTVLVGVLAVAMVVAGAGLVISNELNAFNHVEDGITLSFAEGMFPEYTDWAPGTVHRNVTYDLGVRLESSINEDAILVFVEVTKATGINVSDLTVQYWDGIAWLPLTFIDGGDSLIASFGPGDGFPVTEGYDVTTQFIVTYSVNGDYDITLWAETVETLSLYF